MPLLDWYGRARDLAVLEARGGIVALRGRDVGPAEARAVRVDPLEEGPSLLDARVLRVVRSREAGREEVEVVAVEQRVVEIEDGERGWLVW